MRPVTHRRLSICNTVFFSLLVVGIAFAGSGASITLQPVPPKTVPPSDYPPGTTIVGQEIILGSVPARVWLEVQATGFPTSSAPDCLKTIQARIDATDIEMNGGGYSGSAADCDGIPGNGGDLTNAMQSCVGATGCRATMSGLTGLCFAGEPSYCQDGVCAFAFQDECDPRWIAPGFGYLTGLPIQTINARFGATVNGSDPSVCMNDFFPSYLGTLVIDVPANAKGTYTIDFNSAESFMQHGGAPPDNAFPFIFLNPGIISVPCGRCCSGYGSGSMQCSDHVTKMECADTVHQVFTPDAICIENGGTECPECASNGDCDDGITCTLDQCSADHVCVHTPINAACDDGLFCNGPEICEAGSGCATGLPPCDPNQCDENADECRAGIPTVSNWGLVILILAVLITAKLRYRRQAVPIPLR